MATSVGDLFGRMILEASQFEAGIQRSDRALGTLDRSTKRTAQSAVQASAGLGSLAAAERRVFNETLNATGSIEKAARALERYRQTGQAAESQTQKFATSTAQLNTSTDRLDAGLATLGIRSNRLDQAFRALGLGGSAAVLAISAIATAATLATGAVIGLAVAMTTRLLKATVSVGSFAENARISLDAILGSVEQGARAFDLLNTLAAKVPQTFEQLVGSARTLGAAAGGSADELARLVQIAADIQATFPHISFEEVASNLQRALTAGIASADLFRERGVSAMLGFQAGATVSAEETRRRILEQWELGTNGMVGATERMAGTFTGIVSMLEDAWFRFRLQVGESGTFDAVKTGLEDVRQALDRLEDSGALERLAQTASDLLVPGIEAVSGALVTLLNWINENERAIREWGTVGVETIRVMATALINLADIAATPAQVMISSAQAMREAVAGNFDAARERVQAMRQELLSVQQNLEDIGTAADRSVARIARVFAGGDVFDRVMRRLAGQGTEAVPPRPAAGTGTGAGRLKTDPFKQAIDRLAEGRREIAALEAALEGTSVDFDATAERAKLLESTVRSIAKLDLSTDQREQLQNLIPEWTRYESVLARVEEAEKRRARVAAILEEQLDRDTAANKAFAAALERDRQIAFQAWERDFDRIASIADSVAGSIGDAFTSVITQSRSFVDAFRGVVDAIIAEVIRLTVVKEVAGFIASLLGQPGIPGRPAEVARPSDVFRRGYQHGGPIAAGQLAIVGEAGPELFVPRQAGTVIPNDAAFGGGREVHYHTHNSYEIRALDSRGVRQVLEQHSKAVASTVRREERLRGRR
jgi:phage tail tape-measure protein